MQFKRVSSYIDTTHNFPKIIAPIDEFIYVFLDEYSISKLTIIKPSCIHIEESYNNNPITVRFKKYSFQIDLFKINENKQITQQDIEIDKNVLGAFSEIKCNIISPITDVKNNKRIIETIYNNNITKIKERAQKIYQIIPQEEEIKPFSRVSALLTNKNFKKIKTKTDNIFSCFIIIGIVKSIKIYSNSSELSIEIDNINVFDLNDLSQDETYLADLSIDEQSIIHQGNFLEKINEALEYFKNIKEKTIDFIESTECQLILKTLNRY